MEWPDEIMDEGAASSASANIRIQGPDSSIETSHSPPHHFARSRLGHNNVTASTPSILGSAHRSQVPSQQPYTVNSHLRTDPTDAQQYEDFYEAEFQRMLETPDAPVPAGGQHGKTTTSTAHGGESARSATPRPYPCGAVILKSILT